MQNINAMNFKLDKTDTQIISDIFQPKIIMIPTHEIKVSLEGEWNHKVYQTLDDALQNNLGFIPSPLALSKNIKKYGILKPVRVIKSIDKEYKYDLVSGRIRYWAFVIAHIDDPQRIPAYIKNKL